jgi:hypothetical protein
MPARAAQFPLLVAWAMAAFSSALIFILLYELWKQSQAKRESQISTLEASIARNWTHIVKAEFTTLLFAFMAGLLIWSTPRVGFELAAGLFLILGMFLLAGKKAVARLYVPVLLVIALVLLFRVALEVRLPVTYFPFWN